MSSTHRTTEQKGFTIIEVLIATTIFSYAFIIIALGFVEINKMYRQGISIRRVQQSSRFIVDDILRAARPATLIVDAYDPVTTNPNGIIMQYSTEEETKKYCIHQVTDDEGKSRNSLYKYTAPDNNTCPTTIMPKAENMMERGVYLLDTYTLTSIEGGQSAKIELELATGSTELLEPSGCQNNIAGRQFCGVSRLSTTVSARGGAGG